MKYQFVPAYPDNCQNITMESLINFKTHTWVQLNPDVVPDCLEDYGIIRKIDYKDKMVMGEPEEIRTGQILVDFKKLGEHYFHYRSLRICSDEMQIKLKKRIRSKKKIFNQ